MRGARPAAPLKPATLKPLKLVAPVGGLNTTSAAEDMPLTDCPALWNMIGSEQGLRARLGYVEWVTGLTGTAGDNTVRTMMPFTGGKKSTVDDRLFCATLTGIYDVTNSTGAPGAKKITFGTQNGDAGYGTWWTTVNTGDRFLLYCDEENGYYIYRESTDTWAKVTNGAAAGQIGAPGDATQYVGGTFFMSRNWFVRKDSTIADYLDVNAVFGAPAAGGGQFDFGSKFKAGGYLTNLYNWSYDGGSGLQNYLVAVSSGGDIVIYAGLNPNDASSFFLRGSWQVGGVPSGRRIATDFGGDGLVLTSAGIFPLSKLIIGNPAVDRTVYSTLKISNIFSTLADQQRLLKGWSMRFHPNDAALLVTVPTADGQATQQFAMSLATRSWARYRNLPIVSAEAWRGKLYFGTHDGRVCISTGYVDDVKLADPTGQTFSTVDWSLVTRAASDVTNKIVRQVRPTILAGQGPLVNAEARFNFDQTEARQPLITNPVKAGAAVFDVAKFDQDVWAGDSVTSRPLFGASGRGTSIGAAVRGSAFSRTVLTGVDVLYEEGGFF